MNFVTWFLVFLGITEIPQTLGEFLWDLVLILIMLFCIRVIMAFFSSFISDILRIN